MVFSSDWNKSRWATAKNQAQSYKELTGEESSIKNFWRKKNPLQTEIKKYMITYELSYKDKQGRYIFSIAQDSIEYYARVDSDITQTLENVKQQISSIFRGKGISWTYDNLNIQPRGVEIVDIDNEKINYSKIRNQGGYFPTTQKKISVEKTKGLKTNINKYEVDIWEQ